MTLVACAECERQISDEAFSCPHCGKPMRADGLFGYEYRSQATLFGLPLVHIATGINPVTRQRRVARGVFAFGDVAVGVFAVGGVAVGFLALGGVSIGVLAALGGVALGGVTLGGVAVGAVALGGAALGYYAMGGGAVGVHTVSALGQDPVAIQFFEKWLGLRLR
jgi:hypothetical protein